MATVKAWKHGEANQPSFPEDFEIVRKVVLQVTDLKTNHNKYYALELHAASIAGVETFRIFTHYGRTDDLETNPEAGQKECRYFDTRAQAESNYQSIYREKTSPRKGYKEVALASSRIGSQQARGKSVGDVDDKTLARLKPETPEAAPPPRKHDLPGGVERLVRYIYDEATSALTGTIAARITAHGIETPLGILTIGQIEKGEDILGELYETFQGKARDRRQELERLTGDFYTAVPHRIGRSRAAIATAVIDSLEALEQKQSTLQLMKDMLQVNGESGSVLFDARIDAEYDALKCQVGWLDHDQPKYREVAEFVLKSQVKTRHIQVKNVLTLRREGEWESFTSDVGNERLLFHGSRIQNWVGILSRGILLPRIVVSMGVNRTDPGWLGHGIYFGDAACTSLFYTTPGRHGTRLVALARVALGKKKDYTKITYGLTEPPSGYNSCHGVRNTPAQPSQFADDEYVIYTPRQQRLEYLVELAA
jgi:poly [ADP-ribose] polymerase